MKPYFQTLAVLFLLCLPSISIAGQFKITQVSDGDTVAIESHHLKIIVRLAGIDAPEISKNKKENATPYSQQAKRYLSGLVLDKFVALRRYGRSPEGHILAVIHRGTTNINLEMVKAGLAEAEKQRLPKGFDITPYLKAESEARKAMRGIWSRNKR